MLDTTKMACGVGLLGVGLGLYAKQSRILPDEALRPPGALPETQFQGACIRCGLCVRECHLRTGKPTYPDVLKLAKPEDPIATGTPYFIGRTGPCEMCEDIPCVAACPTGALNHELKQITEARMGLAVLIDHETCLNFLGLRCDVCYRECPLIDKAITLEYQHNTRTGKHAMFLPTVHSNACTGCGICEKVCILEEAAIKVLPIRLAKGEIGGHYRLGWEEKARKGESLIENQNIITMPTRMPEGVSLPGKSDLPDPGIGPLIVPSKAPGLGDASSAPLAPSPDEAPR